MLFKIIENFISEKDSKKILEDVKSNFKDNFHKDNLESGSQTQSNLHIINTANHWKIFFNKLNYEMQKVKKTKISKCWSLKINAKQNPLYHRHGNFITSVFYLQNEDSTLGTHLKDFDINIPGKENSIVIFDGDILHDAIFPKKKLKKSRYTLITDYYK